MNPHDDEDDDGGLAVAAAVAMATVVSTLRPWHCPRCLTRRTTLHQGVPRQRRERGSGGRHLHSCKAVRRV